MITVWKVFPWACILVGITVPGNKKKGKIIIGTHVLYYIINIYTIYSSEAKAMVGIMNNDDQKNY